MRGWQEEGREREAIGTCAVLCWHVLRNNGVRYYVLTPLSDGETESKIGLTTCSLAKKRQSWN